LRPGLNELLRRGTNQSRNLPVGHVARLRIRRQRRTSSAKLVLVRESRPTGFIDALATPSANAVLSAALGDFCDFSTIRDHLADGDLARAGGRGGSRLRRRAAAAISDRKPSLFPSLRESAPGIFAGFSDAGRCRQIFTGFSGALHGEIEDRVQAYSPLTEDIQVPEL